MRMLRAALLAAWAIFSAAPALADLAYTQGTGTTIFDFTCFTSKHCVAHVSINSAGTEIFTSGAPGQVTGANGTFPVTGTVTANAGTNLNTSALATAAKQPALGTAGAASTDVITVQGIASGTAQPVSAASLPLPSGAATAAKQPALGTAGSAATDVITVQGIASGTAQPVSGTVASSNWPATVDMNSGNKSASTPRFVIATDQPNLTTALNVACSNCTGSGLAQTDAATFTPGAATSFAQGGGFFQTTATSNALTNLQYGAFQLTANRALHSNLRTAAGVETGVAAAPLQVSLANHAANATAVKTDASATTQPVSGTVTANAGTNLNTSALALDASVSGISLTQGATTSGQKGNLIQAAVTTAAPSYTTAQTSPLSLTTAGALRTSLTSLAGTAIDTNSGNKSAGTQRVVLATDQVNLTTPLNVNKAQVNGVTTSAGAGAVGTGSQRVSVGQDTTTLAGSAPGTAGTPSANVVSVQGATSMTPMLTTPASGTVGGATASFLQPAASDNAGVVKAGAGTLYGAAGFNNSVTINYLRYYNATTGFAGCNSATNLIAQFQIPAAGGFSIQLPVGVAFATGLSICVTSGYATTDTTAATASAMSITTVYK